MLGLLAEQLCDWVRAEDEMAGWCHRLDDEFEQAPGVGDGKGSLSCCSSWGCKDGTLGVLLEGTQRVGELLRSHPRDSDGGGEGEGKAVHCSLFPEFGDRKSVV